MTGYTHLTAAERPYGWLPAQNSQTMAHDLLEHLAGPTQEFQALGAYYAMRWQWSSSREFYWELIGVFEEAVEDLSPYHNQYDDLFREAVELAMSEAEFTSEWELRYGDSLVPLIVQALSKGFDDANRTYGNGPEAYDHFIAVQKALEERMETGGAFYINLETYQTSSF